MGRIWGAEGGQQRQICRRKKAEGTSWLLQGHRRAGMAVKRLRLP